MRIGIGPIVVLGLIVFVCGCEPTDGESAWEYAGDAESGDVGEVGEDSGAERCTPDWGGAGGQPERWSDPDEDYVNEHIDNCPRTDNPEQMDADGDGIGDVCDSEPETECSDCGSVGEQCESQSDCCEFPSGLECREGECVYICAPLTVVCRKDSDCCHDSCVTGEDGGGTCLND